MKKTRVFLFFALITSATFLISSTIHASDAGTLSGKTMLQITPIDEANPRLYEINDLNFGRHSVKEFEKGIHPQEDLVIDFLDARIVSTPWNLQVKMMPLNSAKSATLKQATLKIGQGKLVGENTSGIQASAFEQNLAGPDFQTILTARDKSTHGQITYTIKKEDIALQFGKGNKAEKYQATNFWRFINAE